MQDEHDEVLETLINGVHEEIMESTAQAWTWQFDATCRKPTFDSERIGNTLHVTERETGRKFQIEFRKDGAA